MLIYVKQPENKVWRDFRFTAARKKERKKRMPSEFGTKQKF